MLESSGNKEKMVEDAGLAEEDEDFDRQDSSLHLS